MRRALRRYARRDQNEPAIVDALRTFGFSVLKHSGRDEPDLILGKRGIVRVVEVKTPDGKLEPGQADFWQRWKGNGKIVLRDVEDVPVLDSLWTYLSADLGTLIDYQREKRTR